MFTEYTESELLQELVRGSTSGFAEICRRYTRRLYAYCRRYTRSECDVEELVQDIFMGLWNYRAQIDPAGALEPLILAIARRRCVDMVRETLNSPIYEDYVDSHGDIADEAVDHLEYEEYMAQLVGLVRKLPAPQRRVVELSRFHHFTNQEIASRLGISEKTVRNRLSLALKQLRSQMDRIAVLMSVCIAFAMT